MAAPTYDEIINQLQNSQANNTSGIDTDEIKKFLDSLNLPTLSQSGVVPYADLASATNKFMTEQAKAPYVANLPNYQNMLDQATTNAWDQLQGKVSQGTINQLKQTGAEFGVETGSPLGDYSNAKYMKDLGLTAEGQTQRGQQNFSNLFAMTPVPELLNPASIYVPEHMAALELAAALAARQKQGPGGGGSGGPRGGGGGGLPGTGLGQQGPLGGPTGGSGGGGGPNGYNPFGTNPANKNANIAAGRDPWDSGGGLWSGYDPNYMNFQYDTLGLQPPGAGNFDDFSSWLQNAGNTGIDINPNAWGDFTPFSGMFDQPSWDFYNQATGGGDYMDYFNPGSGGSYGLPGNDYGLSIFGGGLNDYLTGTGGGFNDFGAGLGGSMYDFSGGDSWTGSSASNAYWDDWMGDYFNDVFTPSAPIQTYDNTPIDWGSGGGGGGFYDFGGGGDYGGGDWYYG